VTEYETPTVPVGKGDAVVIESGALIVMENDFVAVCDPLSATRAVKLAVVAAVGIPLITPPADSVKPAGSVPDVVDHEYGGVPPVAVKLWEYIVPTSPAGKGDAVVIASGGGLIVMENDFVAVCDPLSATRAVMLAVVAVVGFPLMTPPVDSANPAGSVPDVMDHEYGGVPPVAIKVWEYVVPTVPVGKGDDVVIDSGGGAIVMENGLGVLCPAPSAT
jgi:hypothetical protein